MSVILQKQKPLYEGRRCSYSEYLALEDDGFQYEIVQGVMRMVPAPLEKHQDIVGEIYYQLRVFLQTHPLGKASLAPRDVKLSEEIKYQPDLLFIRNERLDISRPQCVEGAPDLIIEVLSDKTLVRDIREKFYDYEKYGVKEYWIMNPNELLASQFYGLEEHHYRPFYPRKNTIHSQVITGFSLNLKQLEKAVGK